MLFLTLWFSLAELAGRVHFGGGAGPKLKSLFLSPGCFLGGLWVPRFRRFCFGVAPFFTVPNFLTFLSHIVSFFFFPTFSPFPLVFFLLDCSTSSASPPLLPKLRFPLHVSSHSKSHSFCLVRSRFTTVVSLVLFGILFLRSLGILLLTLVWAKPAGTRGWSSGFKGFWRLKCFSPLLATRLRILGSQLALFAREPTPFFSQGNSTERGFRWGEGGGGAKFSTVPAPARRPGKFFPCVSREFFRGQNWMGRKWPSPKGVRPRGAGRPPGGWGGG